VPILSKEGGWGREPYTVYFIDFRLNVVEDENVNLNV